MKKKIIKSLKISSLLGFACNNIKADYTLALYYNINFTGQSAILKLKGDNKIILNDPTKSEKFLDILNSNKCHHEVSNFEDIKNKYVPVYYYLKGQKDPKICIVYLNLFGEEQEIGFNGNEENVNEVFWVKKSDKKNIVTFCSYVNITKDIESTKFLVDKEYIYNLFLKSYPMNYKSIADVKKKYDINITLDKDGNQNIEIIQEITLKISDTEEFKIYDKDVKDNDFITPLNNLENLYIKTDDIRNVFYNSGEINEEAKLYIFEYKSKKYYIISDEKLKQKDLFGFLKTKNNLKDKDLIFDPNGDIKVEGETGFLVPGEYKIIEKKPEPEPKPQTSFKYIFTGDTSLSNWIEKGFVTKQKVKVQSLFNDQDTSKYVFVAIKEGTNERFINDQIIEPGTYELKREEKPKKDDNKTKEQGQGNDPEKAKKCCNCC